MCLSAVQDRRCGIRRLERPEVGQPDVGHLGEHAREEDVSPGPSCTSTIDPWITAMLESTVCDNPRPAGLAVPPATLEQEDVGHAEDDLGDVLRCSDSGADRRGEGLVSPPART